MAGVSRHLVASWLMDVASQPGWRLVCQVIGPTTGYQVMWMIERIGKEESFGNSWPTCHGAKVQTGRRNISDARDAREDVRLGCQMS